MGHKPKRDVGLSHSCLGPSSATNAIKPDHCQQKRGLWRVRSALGILAKLTYG